MGKPETMNVLRKRLHVLDRCGRQNPVTQIEDVSRSSVGHLEDGVGPRKHPIDWRQQQRGIQVALNRAIEADARPCFVKWNAPVGANHITEIGRASCRERV